MLLVARQRRTAFVDLHFASFRLRSPHHPVHFSTRGTDGLVLKGPFQTLRAEGMFAFQSPSLGCVCVFQTDGTGFLSAFSSVCRRGAECRLFRTAEQFLEKELFNRSYVGKSPSDGELRPITAALKQKLRKPSLQVLAVA